MLMISIYNRFTAMLQFGVCLDEVRPLPHCMFYMSELHGRANCNSRL